MAYLTLFLPKISDKFTEKIPTFGEGGSSRLGQIPNFYRKLVSGALHRKGVKTFLRKGLLYNIYIIIYHLTLEIDLLPKCQLDPRLTMESFLVVFMLFWCPAQIPLQNC